MLRARLLRGFLRALPAADGRLPRACDGQFPGRRIGADGRAGADGGVLADRYGRDQGAVRADKSAVLNDGTMFVRAVVVAGDRAGADVDCRTDGRIADIAQVIRLRIVADYRVLHLDEVANVRAGMDFRTGTQARVRTDDAGAVSDDAVEIAVRLHDGAGGERGIADAAERADAHLVAERDGMIVGYAYAGPFKGRAAYDWAVELSVYVSRDARRGGIGRTLYAVLEEVLGAMGILNLYACIACPAGAPDETLNHDSVRFHERMGYALAGRFRLCGCKFGRWYDMVWMEKMIGGRRPDPAPVKPFDAI